jgi:tryptophan 2,3-dioxygenase
MATTYWDYIRVEELLRLQGGLDDDESKISNHEVVFIVVHQVFELWFKLVLRELVTLRDVFKQDMVDDTQPATVAMSLDRLTRIFRAAVAHFDVVESIRTRDYLDFRDDLFPASGFQSAQLREIELLLGLPDADRIKLAAKGRYLEALKDPSGGPSPAYERVQARRADKPTLLTAVGSWLYRTPIRCSGPGDEGDQEVVDAFLEDSMASLQRANERSIDTIVASGTGDREAIEARYRTEMEMARRFFFPDDMRLRRIRAAVLFIESYQELPLLAWPRKVLAGLVEFEQALVMFRQRHARMVERIIGRRPGTGGSSGVDYLDETATAYRVFRDLWTVKTFQVRRADLPALEQTDCYEFRASDGNA